MALDVSKISATALPASIRFAGETVAFTYYAGKGARAFEDELQRIANFSQVVNDVASGAVSMEELSKEDAERVADGGRKDMCKALASVLASWDVTDDGKEVPIKADALDKLALPTAFYSQLASKIGEELNNGGKAPRTRR